MPRIIEEVAVLLGVKTKGAEKSLDRVDKKVKGLGSTFKKLGIALAGVFSARAVFRGFAQTIRTTDDLIKTAKGVGFAVNEYQRMVFAMDQVGVSAESLRIGLGDLQKRVGNPNFAKFYKAVGLDPKALQAMTPAGQLDAVLDRLRTVPDAKLVTVAGGLLEEQAGKDFAKIIRQWDEFARARRDYDRYIGGGLGRAGAQDIERLRSQTKLLGMQWDVLKQQIVGESAPAITAAIEGINKSGVLAAMGRDISSLIRLMNDFADAAKLAQLEWERLMGGPMSRTPLSGKNVRTGERAEANVPDLSPSGIFSKTIDPASVARARRRNVQLESGEPGMLIQNNEIHLHGYESSRKAGADIRRELEKQKRAGAR